MTTYPQQPSSPRSSRSSSDSSAIEVPVSLVRDDNIDQKQYPTTSSSTSVDPPSKPTTAAAADAAPTLGHGPKNAEKHNQHKEQHQHQQEPAVPNNVDGVDEDPFVPLKERHGLLPFLCLVRERKEPRDYQKSIKHIIVASVSFAAMVGPMGGSIFLPAMDDISHDLNSTRSVVNVSYGLYISSLGIFPIWWSSISEQFGRRATYIISFFMYTCFLIGCAMSKSIGMIMAFRILSGAAAAAVQAVGAGTIGDIYVNVERGTAMGYFYLGPLIGPLVGPLAGGAIVDRWGWQGTQWFLTIISAVILSVVTLALPETLRVTRVPKKVIEVAVEEKEEKEEEEEEEHIIGTTTTADDQYDNRPSHRRASLASMQSYTSKMNRDDPIADPVVPCMSYSSRVLRNSGTREAAGLDVEPGLVMSASAHTSARAPVPADRPIVIDFGSLTPKEKAYTLIIKPLHSILFLRYPSVLCAIAYSSYCFCCLYFLNISIESLYTRAPYDFKPLLVGLTYIPNSVGYLISSLTAGRWSDRVVRRVRAQNGGQFIPEARYAEHVFFGAILYPLALIFFGWTAQHKLHWALPLVGTFLFGIASMIIFGTTMTYLVDALPGRGSSATAVSNLVRMILAAVATFVGEPLQNALGFGWLYTMWGLLGLALVSLLVLLRRNGKAWREKTDFDMRFS